MENNEDKKKLSEQKKKAQSKYEGRLASEDSNPCLKEQELTYKCLDEHKYDDDACKLHFDNYKICKSFWLSVQRDRRRRNITPFLPPAEERAKIKEQFFEKRSQL
ncbi:coiled-coil-helix-coiled-coil-helix domain-containing protein 7 [Nasonia vitripennis]|uniref:Coiled-coil-helix-coiled-coil-helix domain-containing protein 7 n=1 Tax=Nasonia vitripennis TaxID=7425 RepID=A0A7M7HE97_NASVI|nr:coiled-coil-helix-coiled-coil-helix domain-containing protein 7 [Nasonia vitripennis]XP_008212755.1 coiled-coil-helix-coiled-coil-helix domain-containing protein 7 [Nasonia vitripennis]XP_008212757.1 coiled-coil-helix-coiled-coil-helix domain-containing protein 7 [Nasonia vitripennis]